MAQYVHVSGRHNAVYDAGDFNRAMVHACAQNGQISGCAESSRSMPADGQHSRSPSDQWLLKVAGNSSASEILDGFCGTVRSHLRKLYEMGLLKQGQALDVAVDMHLIPRYDKSYGAELVRSKAKDGTYVFERYITVQCIVAGGRLVLGVMHMPALEDLADFVRKIVCSARRTGAKVGTVMMDREFFAASVIAALDDMGVKYLIPCKNTDTVVFALAEFAAGRRDVTSGSVVEGAAGTAPYTMVITERKKCRKDKKDGILLPHEMYIGFATNVPGVDADSYARRWGIETGYRMIENARARTHSKNPAVRLLCFAYSAAFLNAWVMANAVLRYITGIHAKDPPITQQHLKNLVLRYGVFDYRVLPEPPPAALL